MKICIVGAGSLGCAIGGALTGGGSDVWLVNRSQAHVDAMNGAGLRIKDGDTERIVRVQAATDCSNIGVVDLVIMLVKSFHTRAAIEAARGIVGPDTMVLSLQNGLGHEDILADVVGREHLLAGKTYVGGQVLAPGRIISAARGRHTYIGELDGTISARVRAVAAEFERAGLATTVSNNIIGTIWDKLLVNVATGALSGITGLAYGPLYEIPEVEACALAAVAEGMAVAEASGVRLSTTEPRESWMRAGDGLPREFKASMLQSLEKGSITEIDFVNGAVVRWGERCRVPTPVNRTLVAGIRGIECRMRKGPPQPAQDRRPHQESP